MFPAMLATLFSVAFMVALHARAVPERRIVAQLGLAVSEMAAVTIVGDYFVQLSVIQPSVLAGEADGIPLLTQYNPHGVFIALEELGYLLLSLSLACMAWALSSSTRLERMVRWLFAGGLLVNVLALAGILLRHGSDRGYRFEVIVISVNWLVLLVGTFMMAAIFRRDRAAGDRAEGTSHGPESSAHA